MTDCPNRYPYTDRVADSKVREYVDAFNRSDDECIQQYIPNSRAADFLLENAPKFECPDPLLEKIYYFRWWTFRKHLRKTPYGFVITEFLPKVPWSGTENTIVCASGFHLGEARWLKNAVFAEDYLKFWYRAENGHRRDYCSWLPYAALQLAAVTGHTDIAVQLLEPFARDLTEIEQGLTVYGGNVVNRRENGLLFGYDFFEGGEMGLSSSGFRPLLNSAYYASARAVATIAALVKDEKAEAAFAQKADGIQRAIHTRLWDAGQQFFVVHDEHGMPKPVRELGGFAPWYFGAADEGYADAFLQLRDPQGFRAPYGPTVAEQRHPDFTLSYTGHECQWNGPSWPFATSMTLGALENLLNDYRDHAISCPDYYDLLHTYAASHHRVTEEGTVIPWIDEDLNPYTGDWISRTRLKTWENGTWCDSMGGYERGKDYNHSQFVNHIIGGLIGVRASLSDTVTIHPLVTERQWPWFCLENVPYHQHRLDIVWDQTGEKYQALRGFSVWLDGDLAVNTARLQPVSFSLTAAPDNE